MCCNYSNSNRLFNFVYFQLPHYFDFSRVHWIKERLRIWFLIFCKAHLCAWNLHNYCSYLFLIGFSVICFDFSSGICSSSSSCNCLVFLLIASDTQFIVSFFQSHFLVFFYFFMKFQFQIHLNFFLFIQPHFLKVFYFLLSLYY